MNSRLALLLFCAAPLMGAPNLAFQEAQLSLDRVEYQLNAHLVELSLFQERLDKLEKKVSALKTSSSSPTSSRLTSLEKSQANIVKDLKTLKTHYTQTTTQLKECQSTLAKLDKQISSDIQTLKSSLQKMVVLLKGEEATYTVQSGDSLGQIAVDHHTTIRTLKDLNNLSSNTIFPGQKLQVP